MYKLIVFDCDGTLLNSKKEITERTLTAVRAVTARGIKVMLASARPFYRLKPILKLLCIDKWDQYSISFNGGLITNNTESETVFSGSFSTQEVKDIISIGDALKTNMFLYVRNGIFSNVNDEKYKKKNPDVTFEVVDFSSIDFESAKIYKIAYVNTPEETLRLRTKLQPKMFRDYEISSSVPQFVEIVPKGITKAKALEIVCKRLSLTPEDIIAFGDQDNDIPLLDYAGCGIAMGNSPDAVKEKATFTTSTNDEDGVAVALEKYFGL